MVQLPGWNSIDGTEWWSSFHFWAGIISLLLLGGTEVLSHRYGKRHEELVALAEAAKERETAARHAAEVGALQRKLAAREPRTINREQHDMLVSLLTPIPIHKDPVLFNPLMSDGEAQAFSEQIKQVLKDSGFPVDDVPFGEKLLGVNRLGVVLWFKDLETPPKRARFIYEAFKRVGIEMKADPQAEFSDADKLVIVVGTHP
jgi:hypothetical protein